ncbi:MAG: sigma-70 family RNA polymerase sigma factor [Actinomycetota bacterium]
MTGSKPPVTDVETLVKQARGGDSQAFEELVRLTHVDVYSLARRLTGDPDDARDVVQETYLRAYRAIGRFRGDAQFSTWLYRITANCASTMRHRRGRHRHVELPDDHAEIDRDLHHDPEAQVATVGLRDRLEAAIRLLPPKLRSVVVLRDLHGLSHRDIAAQLGITESAAKVRLHRARKQLQADLVDDEADEHFDAEGERRAV